MSFVMAGGVSWPLVEMMMVAGQDGSSPQRRVKQRSNKSARKLMFWLCCLQQMVTAAKMHPPHEFLGSLSPVRLGHVIYQSRTDTSGIDLRDRDGLLHDHHQLRLRPQEKPKNIGLSRMHTTYARINNVTAFLSSCTMALLAAIALSSLLLTANPKGEIIVSPMQM